MALAEVVAAAPDSARHTSEQLRTSGGSFKGDMPQDKHVSDEKIGDNAQLTRLDGAGDGGYNIPVLASYEGGMGCDTRHVYTQGMLPENGQSMYYAPQGYDYSQQSSYCSQPQGPYISNVGSGAAGYCGPQYGPYYQQLSPALMQQYFPTEQEVPKPASKKPSAKDYTQNSKSKPGLQGKLGQQGGYKSSLQYDATNNWGFYPGAANGGFYGSSMGYDCYMPQQWQTSARGFQPIPPPQNIGAQGNCVPPIPGMGPRRYENFPRVHSAPTMAGRVLKGCPVKGGATGANWRAKEVTKNQGKGDGPANNGLLEACVEQTQKLSIKPKVPSGALQEIGDMPPPMYESLPSSVARTDYNKEDFQMSYEAAKFFIIKSYSEDDIHKSIKYSVWSSTPNGNKRLDEAYRKAQEKLESSSAPCPVFFFFSVNCSGQFCGVAEMVGSVDFGKNMDFWLQGKWNGCLPVKWHIIKDVPNGHFRHIVLTNNDNKPVTHSRDTQEVHFHQGLEMLKIFKYFPTRTSLLDDFAFYDQRQRVLQERKSKQQMRQQVVKQIKEKATEKMNPVGETPDYAKENVGLVKPAERVNNGYDLPSTNSKEVAKSVEAEIEKRDVAPSVYAKENGRPVKPAERANNGSDLPATSRKEVAKSVEAEIEKRDVTPSLLKVTDNIKLDEKADTRATAETAEDHPKSTREKVTPVDSDKACKAKASKDISTGKESKNCIGKETGNKLDLLVNGGDKKSTPKVANADTSATANGDTSATNGKDDASRIVINYKKALMEGIPGKVIVLDQTIGA